MPWWTANARHADDVCVWNEIYRTCSLKPRRPDTHTCTHSRRYRLIEPRKSFECLTVLQRRTDLSEIESVKKASNLFNCHAIESGECEDVWKRWLKYGLNEHLPRKYHSVNWFAVIHNSFRMQSNYIHFEHRAFAQSSTACTHRPLSRLAFNGHAEQSFGHWRAEFNWNGAHEKHRKMKTNGPAKNIFPNGLVVSEHNERTPWANGKYLVFPFAWNRFKESSHESIRPSSVQRQHLQALRHCHRARKHFTYLSGGYERNFRR